MSSQPKTLFTPEEYLELERNSETKSEYFDGEIFAMGGASTQHVLIVASVVSELYFQLKDRSCNVYPNDQRLRVSPTGLYTYPDVIVVCGDPEYSDDQRDTLTNPTVIIEVLSKSTGDYDRGAKFEMYRTLPSFKEYLLIAQDRVYLEHHVRQPNDTWVLSEKNRLEDRIELVSIGCQLSLKDIYRKTDLLT